MLKKQQLCLLATCVNLGILLILGFFTPFRSTLQVAQENNIVFVNHKELARLLLLDRDRDEFKLESHRVHIRKSMISSTKTVQQVIQHPAATKTWERVRYLLEGNAISQAKDWFYKLVRSVEYSCPLVLRLGSEFDGGYDVCVADNFRPASPCLVYSFGIGNDFSFDDDAVTKLGCEVHSFDPYVSEQQQEGLRRRNSWFHRWGLGGNISAVESLMDNKQTNTLQQIQHKLNHTHRQLDLLKIDIEGGEWSVLNNIITDKGSNIDNIRQIVAEIHSDELNKSISTASKWRHFLTTLINLRRHGFYVWRANANELGNRVKVGSREESCCYDIAWINKRFLPD